MKRNMFGALMTLILAGTIAIPAVHAQTSMNANIPFAFSVGDKQLSAGAYEVRDVGRATMIATRDGEGKVLGIYQYAGPSNGETKLVFDKVGDRYFLRQIWTSVHGQGLQLPESKLEKEVQASNRESGSGAETVIVAMR